MIGKEVEEFREKLKVSQEALHERYKELGEKEKLIASLKSELQRLKEAALVKPPMTS